MKQLNHTFEDDGTFWISYEDFLSHYDNLTVCRLLTDDFGEVWEKTIFPSKWDSSTAGGCCNTQNWTRNRQFWLKIDKQMRVFIHLAQEDKRSLGNPNYKFSIGIYVWTCQDHTKKMANRGSMISTPTFINSRESSCSMTLPPGLYCIMPCTFNPGECCPFFLTIYSEKKVQCGEIGGGKGISGSVLKGQQVRQSVIDENEDRHGVGKMTSAPPPQQKSKSSGSIEPRNKPSNPKSSNNSPSNNDSRGHSHSQPSQPNNYNKSSGNNYHDSRSHSNQPRSHHDEPRSNNNSQPSKQATTKKTVKTESHLDPKTNKIITTTTVTTVTTDPYTGKSTTSTKVDKSISDNNSAAPHHQRSHHNHTPSQRSHNDHTASHQRSHTNPSPSHHHSDRDHHSRSGHSGPSNDLKLYRCTMQCRWQGETAAGSPNLLELGLHINSSQHPKWMDNLLFEIRPTEAIPKEFEVHVTLQQPKEKNYKAMILIFSKFKGGNQKFSASYLDCRSNAEKREINKMHFTYHSDRSPYLVMACTDKPGKESVYNIIVECSVKVKLVQLSSFLK